MKKKFKNWLFSFFKEQITAAFPKELQSTTINGELYSIKKLTDRRKVSSSHPSLEQQNVYDARLMSKHRLSQRVWDLVKSEVKIDNLTKEVYMESSVVVGVRINTKHPDALPMMKR